MNGSKTIFELFAAEMLSGSAVIPPCQSHRFHDKMCKMALEVQREMRERSWKDLKQKQKYKLSEIMFGVVCDYYKAHEQMPNGAELDALARAAFSKIQGIGLGIDYDSIYEVFVKKQARFEERIRVHGIPIPPKPKVRKSEAEKLALKRAARKRKKAKRAAMEQEPLLDQDDRFFFIAGYTSGGAPYGVTWEDMGLEPWEELQ